MFPITIIFIISKSVQCIWSHKSKQLWAFFLWVSFEFTKFTKKLIRFWGKTNIQKTKKNPDILKLLILYSMNLKIWIGIILLQLLI